MTKRQRFTYREWWFCNSDENLFELTREQLFIYRLIIKESK